MNNSSGHNRLPWQQYIYISCMQSILVFSLPHLTFCTVYTDRFSTSLMFYNESCQARKGNIEQYTNGAFEVKDSSIYSGSLTIRTWWWCFFLQNVGLVSLRKPRNTKPVTKSRNV